MTYTKYDFLCGYDTITNVVLFRWPGWREYPRFVPCVDCIRFTQVNYTSMAPRYAEVDFAEFQITVSRIETGEVSFKRRVGELTVDDRARIVLSQLKIRELAAWLNSIKLVLYRNNGILPGVFNAIPGTTEHQMMVDASLKCQTLANMVIGEFYDQFWLAEDANQLASVVAAAKSRWII